MSSFASYQSPFSWRYGSAEMRAVWGEENKRRIWRRLWLAIAEAQTEWALVTREQVEDLRAHVEDVDVPRALEIEKHTRHDLMAELKVFAAQCPTGGGILHLGATSMDVKDNAEVLQIRQSLDLLLPALAALLVSLAEKIDAYAGAPVMAFTHLQPAEPTTLGYRLASYAQDLLADYEALTAARAALKGKGFKGAVGNAASYVMLYGLDGHHRFETLLSAALELPFFDVASQTYSRRQDYTLLCALAALAATAHKFAFDLRLLQSEVIGELAEPFGAQQVGSSAMPFKRNPIDAEKIDSLARAVSAAPLTAWHNHAGSLLERTLDDSANRRTLFPETFLAVDEIVRTLARIVDGLQVNPVRMRHNLEQFGPFAAVERVLMAAVKQGADRQEMHEALRQLSMEAWQQMQAGRDNPLASLVAGDARVARWVAAGELGRLFAVESYTGLAEPRARELADQIRSRLQ
ncbi:MAG TPA: adenylosuccinate lyase [Anaerolineaceae bacterium]|nr:adenylosuccinate lyase [Anaerolineaceae bacterium]